MSVRNYRGTAPTEQQEIQYTFTDHDDGETYLPILTNGNSGVADTETYTNAVSGTLANTVDGIAALIEKSSGGLFARVTATSDGATKLTVRSKFAGEPFTLTWNASGTADDPTEVVINANSGPLDFNCESNWAEGAVPTTGDDIIFHASVGFNLNQIAITFAKISTSHEFTGQIGYSGTPFAGLCTDLDIFGRGRGFINIGTSAITPVIHSTAQVQPGEYAFTIQGSAGTSLTIKGGSAIVAGYQGQTSTFTTIHAEGGRLFIGSGTTTSTINITGAEHVESWAATANINAVSGMGFVLNGVGAVSGILTVGYCPTICNTSGLIAKIRLNGTANVDMTASRVARTVTDVDSFGGFIFADTAIVTFTNAVTGRADVIRAGGQGSQGQGGEM